MKDEEWRNVRTISRFSIRFSAVVRRKCRGKVERYGGGPGKWWWVKKSSNGECRPLIIVASTTVKDLFSKVDAASLLLLTFLPRPPFLRATTLPRPGLSPLLQIGLVVLRVHQDNSGLALCSFQENAVHLSLSLVEGEGGRERSARTENILWDGARAFYVLPFSRSSSQHGFKQFLRVSPRFCASFYAASPARRSCSRPAPLAPPNICLSVRFGDNNFYRGREGEGASFISR